MTANNILSLVFEEQLTETGLATLRAKYPADEVMDMKDDDQFKKARKIRTERNKLNDAIKSRRIEISNQIKEHGDGLIEQVNDIYDHIVTPFEAEDKIRKEAEAEKKRKREEMLANQRNQINSMRQFMQDAQTSTAAQISSLIDAVENIDVQIFDKELIHEAIEVKNEVTANLASALTNQAAFEASEKTRMEQERKANIDQAINALKMTPLNFMSASLELIKAEIERLDNLELSAEEYGDRYSEALAAKEEAITNLKQLEEKAAQLELVENEPEVEAAAKPDTGEVQTNQGEVGAVDVEDIIGFLEDELKNGVEDYGYLLATDDTRLNAEALDKIKTRFWQFIANN